MATRFLKISTNGNKILKSKVMTAPSYKIIFHFSFPFSIEFPTYDKIPEISVKMIRRINDEEGIRKLVMDVFQNMWFVPMPKRANEEDKALLVTKTSNITDVVIGKGIKNISSNHQIAL